MPLSRLRLLLLVVSLCSLPALTQDHSLISGKSGSNLQQTPDFRTPPAATSNEPWRIIPKAGKDKGLVLDLSPDFGRKGIVVSPDGPLAAETTCYAIRSYVVARDSKNSDSTHPVSYSTCQPASRYRLKTADATTGALER